jgi:hypothetical protein
MYIHVIEKRLLVHTRKRNRQIIAVIFLLINGNLLLMFLGISRDVLGWNRDLRV